MGLISPPLHALLKIREIPDPLMKGRDDMNIYETQTGFSEGFNPTSAEGTLLSLLTMARDIRLKLGRQGYLLDSYFSLFLEGANAVFASDAAVEGFECGNELRSLCFKIIDQNCLKKEYPSYITAPRVQIALLNTLHFQERHTKMNLLYATFSDDLLSFATKRFLEDIDDQIGIVCDGPKMNELFNQISAVVDESVMETFHLRLKQRFLIAPLTTIFVQGLTNDLFCCLTNRDSETNKQIFQLLMDSIPKDEEGE